MKRTNKSTDGTSFHDDVIYATPNKLIEVLGEPSYKENDGTDKVNMVWRLETESGDVFTVYDWKEYKPLNHDKQYEFHIGSHNSIVSNTAHNELLNKLK